MSGATFNEWREDEDEIQALELSENDEMVVLEKNRLRSIIRRERTITAGLSPSGLIAFMATESHVRIYDVDLDQLGNTSHAHELAFDTEVVDVALTNEYLAVLTAASLEIYSLNVHPANKNRTTKLLRSGYLLDIASESNWIPRAIAISTFEKATRLAIVGSAVSLETRLYEIKDERQEYDEDNLNIGDWEQEERDIDRDFVSVEHRRSYFCSDPDSARAISFCPRGEVMAVVTNNNRCLIWHIRDSEERVSSQTPIEILAKGTARNNHGMTTATIFRSPFSRKRYVFCTVDRGGPSDERSRSLISPLATSSATASLASMRENTNDINGGRTHGCDYWEPVVAGTVSSDGRYLGLVEREGRIRVFRVAAMPPQYGGGLDGDDILPGQTKGRRNLHAQISASQSSIRIVQSTGASDLLAFKVVAIDRKGSLIVRTYNML